MTRILVPQKKATGISMFERVLRTWSALKPTDIGWHSYGILHLVANPMDSWTFMTWEFWSDILAPAHCLWDLCIARVLTTKNSTTSFYICVDQTKVRAVMYFESFESIPLVSYFRNTRTEIPASLIHLCTGLLSWVQFQKLPMESQGKYVFSRIFSTQRLVIVPNILRRHFETTRATLSTPSSLACVCYHISIYVKP